MSDRIIKLLGSEVAPNTGSGGATNVSSAQLVRALNIDASTQLLITQKTSVGGAVGTISLEIGEELFIEKTSTDTLEHNATNGDLLLVSIAFLG